VFGSDKFAIFYCLEDAALVFTGLKFLVLFVLLSLFKKKDFVGSDEEIDEIPFLVEEKVSVFVF
jgi:hypothetical protein